MRAIRVHEFGPPEAMLLEHLPDPSPGPGQVLVRVKAAGVNPVDAYIRAGLFYKRGLPYTPGADASGIVEATGEGVRAFKPGDKVYTAGTVTGAYAELCVCNEGQVHRLPQNLSFAQGACIGVPYPTAFRALFHKAKAAPGETVLVHGATGGVGIAAVQLAKAWGMKVLGTGGTDKGDRKSTRLNSSHGYISYAVFCLKTIHQNRQIASRPRSALRYCCCRYCSP